MGRGDCRGVGDGSRREQFSGKRDSREVHGIDPFLVTLMVNNQARNQWVERWTSNILCLPGLGLPVVQT
jgi:hypothetical protein